MTDAAHGRSSPMRTPCCATELNISGDDPDATHTEALAIGRWAQEFAAALRDRKQ